MAQADQTIQNATFPTTRADLNNNFAALFSQSSGNSAPSTTVAFQPWVDTSTSPPTWKVRNASNSAWITIGTLDPASFAVGGTVAIANGGTGQTTASAALTALLPSQAGNANKSLVTNGTVASWGAASGASNEQVFTASGTWTKPSSGNVALITVWGAGGGGAMGVTGIRRAGGGGGGGCSQRLIRLADLPATVSVTIGTGGNGRTGTGGAGSDGGDSYFGSSLSAAYAVAKGGTGGSAPSSSSTVTTGGTGGNALTGNGSNTPIYTAAMQGQADGASSDYGGAGGGGVTSSGSTTYTGGNSFYGAAGGGAVNNFSSSTVVSSGGFSINGGSGGTGSLTSGVAGSVPGGGGGGGVNSGGNGAAGLCLVYVW